MTLKELVDIANKAYPDDLVARAFQGDDVGDTLALFIVRELKDTYDEEATSATQLKLARLSMHVAQCELAGVCHAFEFHANGG